MMGKKTLSTWLKGLSAFMVLLLFSGGLNANATNAPQRKKRAVIVRPAPPHPGPVAVVRHPYGRPVAVLPAGHRLVVVNHRNYYFHEGLYYWKGAAGYTVISGPVGFALSVLPAGYRTLTLAGVPYYYHFGTYYSFNPSKRIYTVIDAPPGIELDELPDGFETAYIDATPYYYHYGTYYRLDPQRKVYVTIRPPAGLVVRVIPFECEKVIRAGREHYHYRGIYYEPFMDKGITVYRIVT